MNELRILRTRWFLYWGTDEHTEPLRFMITGRMRSGTITLCCFGHCIGIGRWLKGTL